MSEDLGDMLLKKGMINNLVLDQARWMARHKGGSVLEQVVALGGASEEGIVSFISDITGIPRAGIKEHDLDMGISEVILPDTLKPFRYVVPFKREGKDIWVLIAEPSSIDDLKSLEFATGYSFKPLIALYSHINLTLEKLYPGIKEKQVSRNNIGLKDYTRKNDYVGLNGKKSWVFDEDDKKLDLFVNTAFMETLDSTKRHLQMVSPIQEKDKLDDSTIKLVDHVIKKAIASSSSDVHFEPFEKTFRVRYRIDGKLLRVYRFPVQLANPIISRLKILSKLDIAEKRLPQDGRINYQLVQGKAIDIRVGIIPTFFGEKAVLRLLDKASLQIDVRRLGMEDHELWLFGQAIHRPQGMVLVTGPTGSGKTTTLYSALIDLNKEHVNITTAEDPIEFDLPGVNQLQVHEEIDLTFASSIRSFLRQDPDIIMVGEIRDFETADIAIKAALTGHLVLSTLHTNDAPSALTRLVNMHVEPYLVASSVTLLMAQRLVRKLCPHCKQVIKPPPKVLIQVGFDPKVIPDLVVYEAKGCPKCFMTGYNGRVGMFEIMAMNDELKEMFLDQASILDIKREARRFGMRTLRAAGLEKIKLGLTSIEEVINSTMPDR